MKGLDESGGTIRGFKSLVPEVLYDKQNLDIPLEWLLLGLKSRLEWFITSTNEQQSFFLYSPLLWYDENAIGAINCTEAGIVIVFSKELLSKALDCILFNFSQRSKW